MSTSVADASMVSNKRKRLPEAKQEVVPVMKEAIVKHYVHCGLGDDDSLWRTAHLPRRLLKTGGKLTVENSDLNTNIYAMQYLSTCNEAIAETDDESQLFFSKGDDSKGEGGLHLLLACFSHFMSMAGRTHIEFARVPKGVDVSRSMAECNCAAVYQVLKKTGNLYFGAGRYFTSNVVLMAQSIGKNWRDECAPMTYEIKTAPVSREHKERNVVERDDVDARQVEDTGSSTSESESSSSSKEDQESNSSSTELGSSSEDDVVSVPEEDQKTAVQWAGVLDLNDLRECALWRTRIEARMLREEEEVVRRMERIRTIRARVWQAHADVLNFGRTSVQIKDFEFTDDEQ